MKNILLTMAFITMVLAGCTNNAKKQDVSNVDSVAVSSVVNDSVKDEKANVATEIDSASKQVDELVNQL